jgi:PAN domain/TIR domain
MADIFINYRRDDAPGVAGRLFDYLASRYSRGQLFMDVDAMEPGIDFAKQLEVQISQCHAVIAVIGPHWLDARDQAGHRRLDSDNDYVRVELASALRRDIPVIPVLVDGAVMPAKDRLPDDLKPLARRHALELRHTRFNSDADTIMRALEKIVPRGHVPWRYIGSGAALVLIVVLGLLWPIFNAKLHPPAPVAVNAKPPPLNPMVATTPPVVATPSQSGATVPAAPVQTLNSAAPGTAISLAGLPPGVRLGEMMSNVTYRGSTLRVTEIAADPTVCQAACRTETRCVAWTYAQPKGPDQPPHCALKAVIPEQTPDACCTSAIERVPDPELREPPVVPAGMSGAVRGIELEGGTYHYFGGADATVQACKAACQADGQCVAWDYVRPGIYSTDARCFLKNTGSLQIKSPCCVAGFERQAAGKPIPTPTPPAPNWAPAGAQLAPASSLQPRFDTNLVGSDYREFALDAGEWAECRSACKAESACLAWTFARPGVQGPKAYCWLKNKIPPPTSSVCCISGIERTDVR